VGITAGVSTLAYSTTGSSNGGTISGTTLTLTAADASNPGLVSTGAQTIAGAKTFNNDITAPNFLGNATTATTAGNITATTNTTLTSLTNLATVGTITSGVWSGTAVAIAKGGTGATTKAAAFDALSPMTTAGDIIYGGTNGTGTVLAKGTNGQVLTLASGVPSWASPSGITALAAIGSSANANGASISGSTFNLQPASADFGGVVTTGTQTFAGAKTFNSDLKVNDLTVGKGAANNTTLFGFEAGAALTSSGTNNVAVGYQALKSNTDGTNNVAVGNIAATTLTSGTGNIAIGSQAMRYTTTGSSNNAIGYGALGAVTTASGNIGIGGSSGARLTTGGNNINIGGSAGMYIGTDYSSGNTTGNNSIMIGTQTRPAADGETNQIVIAGGAGPSVGLGSHTTTIGTSATTRAIIYGSTSLSNFPATAASGNGRDFTLEAQDGFTTGNTNGGNIILTPGAANGSGTAGLVRVSSQIEIDGGSPGLGKVLTSDANGVASWTYGTSSVARPTASANILISDKYVFYDGSANGTLTLPAATGNAGKEIIIKNRTSLVVTVSRSGSETIYVDVANPNVTSFTIGSEASNNWVKLVSDGSNWVVFRALF
jgi:hypothetical protein